MNAKLSLQPKNLKKPQSIVAPAHPRLYLWLSKLPKHSLLLNARITREVKAELEDSKSNSERLAELVQQDPAFCLKLFLQGQRQLKQRGGDVQGLVHLISLLGQNQIKTVIDQSANEDMPSEGQRELFAASLFAANLAQYLLPLKHGTRGQHFFLPSLLFNSPLWLMWVAAPKLMQQGQHLVSQQKQPLELLCKEKLGFSLQALLEKTELFLPLPDLTLKALAIDPHKNIHLWATILRMKNKPLEQWFEKEKKPKQLFCSAETGIYLINNFVLALYLDWQGKHIQRWRNFLCRHLKMETDEFNQHVTRVAKNTKLPDYLSGHFAPLYRYRGLHLQLNVKRAKDTSDILEQYLQQLRHSKTLNHCLQLTLEAFTEGSQVEHCLILTIKDKHLQTPLNSGFDSNRLEELDIDCTNCGQLFRALLKKPMAITADKTKLDRIKRQMPAALHRFWQPRPCGIMSLFRHDRPYAIILCDHQDWNEKKQQQFKAIGKQLTQSLKLN